MASAAGAGRPSLRKRQKVSYVQEDSDADIDEERDVIQSFMHEVKLDASALSKFCLAGLSGHLATKEASMSKAGDVDATLTQAFEDIICRGLEVQGVVASTSMEESDDDSDDDDDESNERANASKRVVHLLETSPSLRKRWGKPKEWVGIIFDLAGQSRELVDRMPNKGWAKNGKIFDPAEKDGPYRRAKAILNGVIEIAASWICPTNPDAFLSIFFDEATVIGSSKLLENTVDLYLCGHRSVAPVAGALLSKSLTRDALTKVLSKRKAEDVALKSRLIVGKMRFASLRLTYDSNLIEGKPVPPRIYPWRVKMENLTNAVSFLEQYLEVVPGDTRTVTLAGTVFKNLPVYNRGGQSLADIWMKYKSVVVEEKDRVGEKTFYEIIHLLSTKGQMKDCLSTFYIALRHLDKVFADMMDRIATIDALKDMAGVEEFRKDAAKEQTVADDCKELKKRWKVQSNFLSYEYGREHPKSESNEACHCARHALNYDGGANGRDDGRCSNRTNHEHGDLYCQQCADLFLFFDPKESVGPVAKLVAHVRRNVPGANHRNQMHEANNDVMKELETMALVLGDMQERVKDYAAHRVRWKIQSNANGQILEALDDDGTIAMFVLDHKQKVNDMSYREAMVDYFGKRGKSFCGINLIRRTKKEGKVGFEFIFFDFIVEGYDEQNQVQVCAITTKAMHVIKQEYPEITKIIAKTDNASCMGSPNGIPYIFHLNKELREKYAHHQNGPIEIMRWFNSEAQTSKGVLDTHFAYVNVTFRGYVNSGNDITTHTNIWKALKHNDGIAGTCAILLDTRELAKEKRTLLQGGKQFKINTYVRRVHDIHYFNDRVELYRYTGITTLEITSAETLNKYPKCDLPVTIKEKDPADGEGVYFYRSPKEARFMPDQDDTATNNNTSNSNTVAAGNASKAKKLALALEGAGIKFGKDADHSNKQGINVVSSGGENAEKAEALSKLLPPGWAEKTNGRDKTIMHADTLETLHELEMDGRKVKKLKMTFNRMLEIIRPKMDDWREILFSSPQKIKAIAKWTEGYRLNEISKLKKANGEATSVELTEEEMEQAGEEVVEEAEADEVEDETVRAEPGHEEGEVAEDFDAIDGVDEELGEDELAAAQLRNERVNRVEVPAERRSGRYGRESVLPARFRE